VKVVDANVLVNALADQSMAGSLARQAIHGHALAAPHIIDLEIVATLRRQHLRGLVSASAAQRALARLARTSIMRRHHAALVRRCWELRDDVKTYDAAYVALAEALHVPLLTADARLANAPGIRCEVELLT
jgi:predicted nucleic acid-binding protein